MDDYGFILKKARKKKGYTQKKMAEKMGITTSTIWRMENEEDQRRLSFSKMKEYADFLDLEFKLIPKHKPNEMAYVPVKIGGKK